MRAIGGRGANKANLATVERYNPTGISIYSWSAKASLPSARAWPSGAATINGKIYVPGGLDANASPTKTLFVYRPGTDSWVKKAAMPVASYGGASVVIGGKLYVLTPKANSTLLHRYDPAANTWTSRATGPQGHWYPVAGVIDGKIYVAGTMNGDDTDRRARTARVLAHVWNSSILRWANGAEPVGQIGADLEDAARLLLD